MRKRPFLLLMLPLICTQVSCQNVSSRNDSKQNDSKEFEEKTAAAIAGLKQQFPANANWELLPGDSANSFVLSSKNVVLATHLTDEMAEDSLTAKYRITYYLQPTINDAEIARRRKLQDSVTKESFALRDRYGIGVIADNGGRELTAAEKKEFEAQDEKLTKICPVMPVYNEKPFSLYKNEPAYETIADEKTDKESENMQQGIMNYFITGKFNYDDLLKYREEDDKLLKQKINDLKKRKD